MSNQLPTHAGIDLVHDLPTTDRRDGTAFSGQLGLFYEPQGITAAERLPIEPVSSVETDLGGFGCTIGALGRAEQDIHPIRFGDAIWMRRSRRDAARLHQSRRCRCPRASYLVRLGDADALGKIGFSGIFFLGVKVLQAASRKALALRFLKLPESRADDLTGVVVAARVDELTDETFPMSGECDIHSC